MEVISIERSTYEELLTSFNSWQIEAQTKGWVIGLTTKMYAKY